jgi:integrase
VAEGKDPKVHEVRPGHVRGFLNWRRVATRQGGPKGAKAAERTASARTLQKDRAVLHAVFGFAEELEIRTGNPVAKVRPPKADPREPVILTDDQFEALLTACGENDMLRLYVLALGETGGRCESEVLFLQWEDVSLEDGFLWIASGREGRRTKSGKGRWSGWSVERAWCFHRKLSVTSAAFSL